VSSANLDLVRSVYAVWERGDFSSVEWAHPDIELVFADGPDPSKRTGLTEMSAGFGDFLRAWEDFHVKATEYREVDEERVLVLVQFSGRAKTSGVALGHMETTNAVVFHIHDGEVRRVLLYWDRERALVDLGLIQQGDGQSSPVSGQARRLT
jgi:ketosteroid isomerase-like protein